MATAKKDLDILIESFELLSGVFAGKSRRVADFKLVYPRLAIAQKTSSKTIELNGGAIVKPAFDTWTERILFKESVQGTFGLEIAISEAVSAKELENAASATASSLVRLLGGLAADAVGLKALNSFAELPSAGIAKFLSGASYSARTDATGAIDVPGETYAHLKPGDGTVVTLPIVAARDIVKETRRPTKSRPDAATRRTIARQGDAVGSIALRLRAI